jgi:hypothetical protein
MTDDEDLFHFQSPRYPNTSIVTLLAILINCRLHVGRFDH